MPSTVVQRHFDMEIHGTLCRPTTLMIGTWDPFLSNHEMLLHEMRDYADAQGYDSMVVMLDPPPAKFLPGKWRYPYFDDAAVRVARLQQCGVSAVVQAHFEREHLLLGAAEIFETLLSATPPIAEVWIGARQSLGRGSSGDFERIEALGKLHDFQVKRLPSLDVGSEHGFHARNYLQNGMIQAARDVVGHAPTFARPAPATPITVAWMPGDYHVLPLSAIDAPLTGLPLPLTLHEIEPGFATFDWICPDSPYLAFVEGPAAA